MKYFILILSLCAAHRAYGNRLVLDTSFGELGTSRPFDYPGSFCGYIGDVAADPLGRFIYVTSTNNNAWMDAIITKLDSKGSRDESWGNNGFYQYNYTDFFTPQPPHSTSKSYIKSLSLQHDGSLVAGGQVGPFPLMLRLNPDGTLDQSFNDNTGSILLDYGGLEIEAFEKVEIGKDNSILAVRKRLPNTNTPAATVMYKFHSNGKPDLSFGSRNTRGSNELANIGHQGCESFYQGSDKTLFVVGKGPWLSGDRYSTEGQVAVRALSPKGQLLYNWNQGRPLIIGKDDEKSVCIPGVMQYLRETYVITTHSAVGQNASVWSRVTRLDRNGNLLGTTTYTGVNMIEIIPDELGYFWYSGYQGGSWGIGRVHVRNGFDRTFGSAGFQSIPLRDGGKLAKLTLFRKNSFLVTSRVVGGDEPGIDISKWDLR
jgi:hypothetical protein